MKNKLQEAYIFLRRLLRGRGLAQFRFLRNLDYRIKQIIYGRPKEFILVRGLKLYLDPKNSIQASTIEHIETKLVEAFWRPGDVFVDVGAHLGWYTTLASRAVGDAGKVFAFEPNRKSYELLKKNLAENKCFNVVLEHVAVSDSSGECSVYTIGDLWFGSSLIDPRKDPGFYIEPNLSDYDDRTIIESKVHKTSLDDYFGTRKINFIKTDTEGNDGKVFAGMQNILKNNPDIIIYMEFAPSLLKRFGTDPEELVQEIHRMGFNIFMSDGRTVEPFKPNPRFSGNLFITRRNVHKEIAAIG